MSSPSKFLLAGLASLALAACATDKQEAPLAPTSASLSTTPSCSNFAFIRNDAKAYFSSTKDPVFDAISALETAQTATDQSVTKNAALSVLSRIAAAAKDASLRKSTATPTTGNTLVQDIFLCSTYTGYPTDLRASLGPDGLFEVLGGAGDEPALITDPRYVKSHGTFLYGAQPQSGNTWAGSVSGRFLLYGYVLPTNFSAETLVSATSPFDLSKFPTTVTFVSKIIAGACTPGYSGYPIQHESSILPNASLDFCPTAGAMAPQKSTGFFATLASWITPQSLDAAVSQSAGGLISGLSPFAPVVVNASQIAFTIKQSIGGAPSTDFTDKNVGDAFDVVVTLKTLKGTPLADVSVTAIISGNSGSFTQPQPTTAITNADGVAVFPNWSIDKAGGYTITASAPVLGAGLSVPSNLFQVKNK